MKNQSSILLQQPNPEGVSHTPAPPQRSRVCDDSPSSDLGNGGQTSISPPLNVKVLGSGIDTLYLTLDIDWSRSSLLFELNLLKLNAIEADKPQPSRIADWLFHVQPFGRRGYEFLLESHEYSLRVGNWVDPRQKPSVFVEIRSETLWRFGPEKAVDRILTLLSCAANAKLDFYPLRNVKLSRIDICLDILLPSDLWTLDVLDNIVCRAKDIRPYLRNGQRNSLTGFRIGNGGIFARLYDKGLEIRTKSKKFWMYDLWKLESVPDGYKVIRIEFQLMREVFKDLDLDTPEDLFRLSPNLWAYCTKEWLKMQDRPGTHHTQKNNLLWWETVQVGFSGAQEAEPLIRFKSIQGDQLQLIRQMYGLMTSLVALQQDQAGHGIDEMANFSDCLSTLYEAFQLLDDENDFSDKVFKKRTKYSRSKQQQIRVNKHRDEFDQLLEKGKE